MNWSPACWRDQAAVGSASKAERSTCDLIPKKLVQPKRERTKVVSVGVASFFLALGLYLLT
jgi:hypothetical protein